MCMRILINTGLKALGPQSVSSQGNTLSHLVVSKNELTEVPSEAIRHLRNLHHLNLNDNKITALRKEAFLGLSKVQKERRRRGRKNPPPKLYYYSTLTAQIRNCNMLSILCTYIEAKKKLLMVQETLKMYFLPVGDAAVPVQQQDPERRRQRLRRPHQVGRTS